MAVPYREASRPVRQAFMRGGEAPHEKAHQQDAADKLGGPEKEGDCRRGGRAQGLGGILQQQLIDQHIGDRDQAQDETRLAGAVPKLLPRIAFFHISELFHTKIEKISYLCSLEQ